MAPPSSNLSTPSDGYCVQLCMTYTDHPIQVPERYD